MSIRFIPPEAASNNLGRDLCKDLNTFFPEQLSPNVVLDGSLTRGCDTTIDVSVPEWPRKTFKLQHRDPFFTEADVPSDYVLRANALRVLLVYYLEKGGLDSLEIYLNERGTICFVD